CTSIGWPAASYAGNWQVFGTPGVPPAVRYCQGSPAAYASCLGTEWEGRARVPASIPDGTANTLLFAERYATCSLNGSVACDATDGATAWSRWDNLDECAATFAAWSAAPFLVQPQPFFGGGRCDPLRA